MNYIGWTIAIISCFPLGRLTYPALSSIFELDGTTHRERSMGHVQQVTLKRPHGSITVEIDLSRIPKNQLPERVILREGIMVGSKDQESVFLQTGTEVRVRSLKDEILVVAAVAGPLEGTIRASSTDLAKRIAEQRLTNPSDATVARNEPVAEMASGPAKKSTPEPAPLKMAESDDPTGTKEPANPLSKPAPAADNPNDSDFVRQAETAFPMPVFPSLTEVVDDWKNVPDNAYPKTVNIKVPLGYDLFLEGRMVGRNELPAGSAVKPVELMGSSLKISTISVKPTQISIDVDQTNFKELVRARYEESVKNKTKAVLARQSAERDRLAKSATHEKKLRSYNEGNDPRFDAVRKSLLQGDAGFYELDAASKWRWGDKETIDGAEHEVAYVMMASESAFGVIQRELKALLRDNKVIKWIDVASDQEL
jgi:hypothetical protein